MSTVLLPWKHRQSDRDRLAVLSQVEVELVGVLTLAMQETRHKINEACHKFFTHLLLGLGTKNL